MIQGIRKNKSHCLGSGSKGAVYQGFNEATGQLVAIKEIALTGEIDEIAVDVANEIKLMSASEHPNLVRYFGAYREGDAIQLVMEYVSGGSLGSLIRRYGVLRESVARSYVKDILSGLDYLHNVCKVCHRDIKPENVLLTPEGRCKIADFGASKSLEAGTLLKTCIGTPWYMAPEVVQGEPYTALADIWSLGCTLFEMLVGKHPFSQFSNPMGAMFQIGSSDIRPELPHSTHVSEKCISFLSDCCERNPQQRSSAKQLLQHSWFAVEPSVEQEKPATSPPTESEAKEEEESEEDEDAERRRKARGSFFRAFQEENPLLMCRFCNLAPALFRCDQCQALQLRCEFCHSCWIAQHTHQRAASHVKAPIVFSNSKNNDPWKDEAGLLLPNGQFIDLWAGEQSQWSCGRCNFLNDGPVALCAMCGYQR